MKVKEFEIPVWIPLESTHMQEMFFGFAQVQEVNESKPIVIYISIRNIAQ